jgi:transcriptional regulator with XRE-family HTH domain
MTLIERIGRNVKQRRQARGWTHAELARRAGMHRISVALTESGRSVSIRTLEKLAKALRVKPARLLD